MEKTIFNPKYQALITWLKEQREKKQVTMRDLADKLGCGSSYVNKYEKAQVRIDVFQYVEICRILEVDPADGLKLLQQSP